MIVFPICTTAWHSGRVAIICFARSHMKLIVLSLCATFLCAPILAQAQGRGADFQLTKINKNLVTIPIFAYNGGPQYRTNQTDRWLEVEAEFVAAPEFTDELSFKYFILINGKLLTGEVAHVGILAGREKHSVMYVSPSGLARCTNNQPATVTSVQNISVQIVQKGTVKDELTLVRAPAQWYSTMTPLPGVVFNKSETPFASLFWDRYEQLKPAVR
jgi:hypothetical protein